MPNLHNQRAHGNPVCGKTPIIFWNEEKASDAYARYIALRRAERDDPSLADEECFQILLNDAFRSFETAFCAPPEGS